MVKNEGFQVGDRVRIIFEASRQLWGEFGTIKAPSLMPSSWRVRPDDWPHLDLVFLENELEKFSSTSEASEEGEGHNGDSR